MPIHDANIIHIYKNGDAFSTDMYENTLKEWRCERRRKKDVTVGTSLAKHNPWRTCTQSSQLSCIQSDGTEQQQKHNHHTCAHLTWAEFM